MNDVPARGALPVASAHPVPALVAPPAEAVTPLDNIGFFFLAGFLFMGFSRITDFFLAGFHLPLLFSLGCMMAALIGGTWLTGLRYPVGRMLLALTVWLVLAIPFSVWRFGSFTLIRDEWSRALAAFIIAAALVRTTRQCGQLLSLLLYAFFTTSLLSYVAGGEVKGRFALVQGFYSGANELAEAMIQGCVFVWFAVHQPGRAFWKRALALLMLLPMLHVVVKTGSRGAFVTLLAVACMVWFRYNVSGKALFALLGMVALILGLILVPAGTRARFLTFLDFAATESLSDEDVSELGAAVGSSHQRLYLLLTALEFTLRNPVFGVGPGQFAQAEDNHAVAQGRRKGNWLGTHNTYVQLSSEAGIPAMLLFLGTLIFAWRELRHAERIHQAHHSLLEHQQALATAFALRLLLFSYAVFFCFEHVAYHPFYPTMLGVITGFCHASRSQAASAAAQAPPGVAAVPAAPPAVALAPVPAPQRRFRFGREVPPA